MEGPLQRVRIHFFGQQADRPVAPLAGALGLGPLPRPGGIEVARFDRLAQRAPELFEVVPADATDLWVYAHDVVTPRELESAHDLRPARSGVRRFYFYSSDDAAPIPADASQVVLFRTSLFASTRLTHERAMPALCDDVLAHTGGKLIERRWLDVPSVGFCGFVGSALRRIGFKVLGRHDKSEGLMLRDQAMAALEKSSAVRSAFVRRSSFWGGSMSRFHFDANRQREVRAEFVQNLFDNDYALCVRGKGNFSYRLYEVLSAGRIPAFVNSDCVLPFEDRIDWKQHVVWIEHGDLANAGEIVRRFHVALGPDGFLELQRRNRRLWEEWLSPQAFFLRALQDLSPHADDTGC